MLLLAAAGRCKRAVGGDSATGALACLRLLLQHQATAGTAAGGATRWPAAQAGVSAQAAAFSAAAARADGPGAPDQAALHVLPMPKLSHAMTHGRIVRWFKEEGDEVNVYDVLMEVETDSLTEEVFKVGEFAGTVGLLIESQEQGVLAKVMQPAGERQLVVGTPVAVLTERPEDAAALRAGYDCPTTDVYDDGQPQVKVLAWQSYLRPPPDGQAAEKSGGCM